MRCRISVIKQDVDGGSQTVGNFEIVTREEDNLREWLSLGLKVDTPLAAEQNPDSHLKPLHNKVISHAISARESFTVHKPWVVTRMHTKGKEEQPQGTKSHRMMMTPMGIACSSLAARSLGIQPHSLVHKPSRQRCAMLARFSEANSGIGMAWTPSMHEQAVDSVWPGSFRVNLPRQGSDVNKLLDLNRRL